jgi:hypothetical protein
MSSKTSSGVPRGIILATLVLVFVTSVAVVPHVGVGRYDGHHKMVGLYRARQWQLAAVASMSEIIGANEQVFGGGLFVGYAGTLNHQFLRRPSFCLARTQLITVSSYTMLASTLTTAIATMFMTAPLPGEGPSHC